MHDLTELSPSFIQSLLSHTKSVMNHVFWFTHDLHFHPQKQHYGSFINFTDIKCHQEDFLRELVNTIAAWIYSKSRARGLIKERLNYSGDDLTNAYSFLTTQAFSKFRPGYPQGQFGELLLFNFIQHFFEAPPLLRKMRITTSVGHERFGADAIHVKQDAKQISFFLGESKCYRSVKI